jgi:hypothetical protein
MDKEMCIGGASQEGWNFGLTRGRVWYRDPVLRLNREKVAALLLRREHGKK